MPEASDELTLSVMTGTLSDRKWSVHSLFGHGQREHVALEEFFLISKSLFHCLEERVQLHINRQEDIGGQLDWDIVACSSAKLLHIVWTVP